LLRCPPRIKPGRSTPALVEFIDIAPTVLEFCGIARPASIQGKSLTPLLNGTATNHRDQVFVEYAENEEAMIRTERWKFIYCTGNRARQDGYDTGRPLPGRTVQLFDLDHDPEELANLAHRPEQAQRVADFTNQLAEHLKQTARQPALIPQTNDVHAVLAFCLQPRDVAPALKDKQGR
jgi:choline-sulfatase